MRITDLLFTFAINILFTTSVNAIGAQPDTNGIPYAQIKINGEIDRKIPLRRNGEFTYGTALDGVNVKYATLRSDLDAICFFWRQTDDGDEGRYISPSFTALDPLLEDFERPDRVYCYDRSSYKANHNTFTVFLENRDGEQKLERIELKEGQAHGVKQVSGQASSIGVNVARAALVEYPLSTNIEDEYAAKKLIDCVFVLSRAADKPIATAKSPAVKFPEWSYLISIVCFNEGFRSHESFFRNDGYFHIE